MNKNIIKIKRRIKELKHALHEFNILVSEYADPDDVPCAIDMEICHIEQELCKEYAKTWWFNDHLSDDEKEKWK